MKINPVSNVSHTGLQFGHDKISKNTYIYLVSVSEEEHNKRHVIAVNEHSRAVSFNNVTFKKLNVYCRGLNDLYRYVKSMPSHMNQGMMRKFLTLLTRHSVVDHVLHRIDKFVEYYSTIIVQKPEFYKLRTIITKYYNGNREEALIDSVNMINTNNNIDLEFGDEPMSEIQSDLCRIKDHIRTALEKERVQLHDAYVKLYNDKVRDLLQMTNLDTILSPCHSCSVLHSYFTHDTCMHKLCSTCALTSIANKQCVYCSTDNDEETGSYWSTKFGRFVLPKQVQAVRKSVAAAAAAASKNKTIRLNSYDDISDDEEPSDSEFTNTKSDDDNDERYCRNNNNAYSSDDGEDRSYRRLQRVFKKRTIARSVPDPQEPSTSTAADASSSGKRKRKHSKDKTEKKNKRSKFDKKSKCEKRADKASKKSDKKSKKTAAVDLTPPPSPPPQPTTAVVAIPLVAENAGNNKSIVEIKQEQNLTYAGEFNADVKLEPGTLLLEMYDLVLKSEPTDIEIIDDDDAPVPEPYVADDDCILVDDDDDDEDAAPKSFVPIQGYVYRKITNLYTRRAPQPPVASVDETEIRNQKRLAFEEKKKKMLEMRMFK